MLASIVLPLAAAALSIGAFQDADPSAADDRADPIVVEGLDETERSRQIRSIVDAYTENARTRQIAQFHEPVCPMLVNFPKSASAQVEARIRQVADAIPLGAAKVPCSANLLVVRTDNRTALLDYWDKVHPDIFEGLTGREKKKLYSNEEPVVAWQMTQWLDQDLEAPELRLITNPENPLCCGYVPFFTRRDSGSRSISGKRPSARGAIVVVDHDALDGIDVRQMADYVTMRALVPLEMDEVRELKTATILTLMDAGPDDEIALSLSEWDFAFLKALYSTENIRFAAAQRNQIRSAFEKELAEQREESDEE